MIRIKVINRIPRLLIGFKSPSTNYLMAWEYLIIPSRPMTFLNFVKNILLRDSLIYKDEMGILLSHDNIYNEEDVILAVGVGTGISLIHNCMKSRGKQSFIGIEGSREMIYIAYQNARLNGVDTSKFKLIHGYVGNRDHVYGEQNEQSYNLLDINNFNFDVLELDCEGSEIEILHHLIVKPRHIIVEMHPMITNVNIDSFLHLMKQKGYSLVRAYTVNGTLVKICDVSYYFRADIILKMVEQKWDGGGDNVLVLNFQLI